MNGLRFERRGEGNYYKAILHIGDCYVPISDETFQELKNLETIQPERFLNILTEKVGYSSYLKDQITQVVTQKGDLAPQMTALQLDLRNL